MVKFLILILDCVTCYSSMDKTKSLKLPNIHVFTSGKYQEWNGTKSHISQQANQVSCDCTIRMYLTMHLKNS